MKSYRMHTNTATQLGVSRRNNGTSRSFYSSQQECEGFAAPLVASRECDVNCARVRARFCSCVT